LLHAEVLSDFRAQAQFISFLQPPHSDFKNTNVAFIAALWVAFEAATQVAVAGAGNNFFF
jgi:hypothetical protein